MKASMYAKRIIVLLSIAAFGMLSSACGDNKEAASAEITVSAAVSMKSALTKLEENYERIHPDVHITFNYGSSGTLEQQIEQGAPVDLFLSAGMKQMESLFSRKLVLPSVPIVRNELVLIVPKTGRMPADLKALTESGYKRIAVGTPETVPAGDYTKQSLTDEGIWDMLQNKIVYGKDVRQVLTYVETGNADAGFVYKTDAQTSDKVKTVLQVDEHSHDPIIYPGAVVSASKQQDKAGALLDYMTSDEGQSVFENFGFTKAE
ncbi:molybdate ABC transporter substrate-binding protein [Paenibacillus solisilvae]|uniref:Molybdate ABC transporter substrate-binding protein n=1 Tax=Paenibacillus solisilvae TaxID=2486751 RepID=A0ABW0W1Y5_9BACL